MKWVLRGCNYHAIQIVKVGIKLIRSRKVMVTQWGPCEALLCCTLGEHVLQTTLNKPSKSRKAGEIIFTCLRKASLMMLNETYQSKFYKSNTKIATTGQDNTPIRTSRIGSGNYWSLGNQRYLQSRHRYNKGCRMLVGYPCQPAQNPGTADNKLKNFRKRHCHFKIRGLSTFGSRKELQLTTTIEIKSSFEGVDRRSKRKTWW